MTEKQSKFKASVVSSIGIIALPIFLVLTTLGGSYVAEWAVGYERWPTVSWPTSIGALIGLIAGLVIWILADWSSTDYSADELGREGRPTADTQERN